MTDFRNLWMNSNELFQPGKRFCEGMGFGPALEGKGATSKGKVWHGEGVRCITNSGNTGR